MAFQIGPFQQLAPSNNFVPNGAPGVAGFAPQQVSLQSILQMLAGLMQSIAALQQGWAGATGAQRPPFAQPQFNGPVNAPQFNGPQFSGPQFNRPQFNGPVGGNQQMGPFVPQFAPQAPRFNQFSQGRPQATGFAVPGPLGVPQQQQVQMAPPQVQTVNQGTQQAQGAQTNQGTQQAQGAQTNQGTQQAQGAQTNQGTQQAQGAQTNQASQSNQTGNQPTVNPNQVQSVLAALKAIDDRPVGPITNTPGVAQFDDKMIEKGNLLAGLPAQVAQEVTATLLKKNHAVKESFYNLPVGTILLPFKVSADPAEGTQQYIKWLQAGVQNLAVGRADFYSNLTDAPWVSQFAARSGN